MNRIKFLDGFRGIAVMLVVLFHLGLSASGFSGVELFFVISGFIITLLIVKEIDETGELNLSKFFIRRISRLYPSLILVVLGTLILFINFPVNSIYDKVLSQGFYAALGVENFYELLQVQGYWEAGVKSPLLHLWSICIELQFYLFWPFISKILVMKHIKKAKGKTYILIYFSVLTAVFAFGTIVASNTLTFDQLYYNPLTRVFSFLVGAIIGVAVYQRDSRTSKVNTGVIVALILALSYLSLTYFSVGNQQLFKGIIIIFTSLFGGLIYFASITRSQIVTLFFENKLILFLGKISYSLYLIHMPVIFFVSNETILKLTGVSLYGSVMKLPVIQLIISILLALLLHVLVETKVKIKQLIPAVLLVVAFPLITVSVVNNSSTLQVITPSQKTIEQRWIDSEPIVVKGKESILFVGDSWSRRTAMGFSIAVEETPDVNYQTLAYGVGNGSLMDPDYYLQNGKKVGMFKTFAGYLSYWDEAVELYNPSTVILQFGNSDQSNMIIDNQEVRVGSEAFSERFVSQYQKVIDYFNAKKIKIYVTNVINNAHTNNDGLELTLVSDAMNKNIESVVKKNKETVTLLDVQTLLADGSSNLSPLVIKGVPMYDETFHNSYDGSVILGEWIIGKLSN